MAEGRSGKVGSGGISMMPFRPSRRALLWRPHCSRCRWGAGWRQRREAISRAISRRGAARRDPRKASGRRQSRPLFSRSVPAAGHRTRPQAARAQDDLRRIFSEGRHPAANRRSTPAAGRQLGPVAAGAAALQGPAAIYRRAVGRRERFRAHDGQLLRARRRWRRWLTRDAAARCSAPS